MFGYVCSYLRCGSSDGPLSTYTAKWIGDVTQALLLSHVYSRHFRWYIQKFPHHRRRSHCCALISRRPAVGARLFRSRPPAGLSTSEPHPCPLVRLLLSAALSASVRAGAGSRVRCSCDRLCKRTCELAIQRVNGTEYIQSTTQWPLATAARTSWCGISPVSHTSAFEDATSPPAEPAPTATVRTTGCEAS